MQEDKLDKWLASSLKRAQEQAPISYEEGAWEAFERKRQAQKIRTIAYWVSGIAASLILLLVTLNSFDFQSQIEPDIIALDSASERNPGIENPTSIGLENFENEAENPQSVIDQGDLLSENQAGSSNISESTFSREKTQSKDDSGREKSVKNSTPIITQVQLAENRDKPLTLNPEEKIAGNTASEIEKAISDQQTLATAKTDSVEAAKVELLKKQIAELTGEDEEVVRKEYSSFGMALGLAPGYGSGQQDNQSVLSSGIGLGVQMNLELGQKLTLGSGMALNYFNQTSEGEGVVRIANAAYPGNERTEIQQVQMDIPLFVTYPVTRSKSISIQAGFSNLVAFNQSSQREFLYTRQVSVVDAQSALSNSVSFRSESVANLSTLDTPSSKFYPFATANLGVNIRVLESKKTSYLLMPFYNYPIQDITGTGTNIGFFGAALKVNFGNFEKK